MFADNPHSNFRNALKVHGLNHTFRGCEKEAVFRNGGIVDMIKLITNSTTYDLVSLPILLSEAVATWVLERELYKEAELKKRTVGGAK